ncbi:ABC transporter permease [Galbitalea soli]|uniref:ABC transporter permease n=1 Tax=Galbitalea soli TaxID=1268042 RepID=A0A7C9PMR2_9MICO|nr:ABC transporter permease [Galbitalea soli]NEM91092.1 ABC transporter permease [Galbitalea soli]NYJ29780.1 ABC-type nitrate/sulfonate/bicarbonate transport system permease component [Galbitalea soli]
MRTRRSEWLTVVALEAWLPVVLVVAWWFGSASSTSVYFPPLSSILGSFAHDWLNSAGLASNLLPSLELLGLGFGVALASGVVMGTVLGLTPALERASRPLLEILRAIPGVALLPIFIVLFGIDQEMKVLLIAFGSFWPILLNTVDGVRGVEPLLFEVAEVFRFGRIRRLLSVVFPGASPQIFAGARTALSISLIILVVSETVGGNGGIGYFLLAAQRNFAISSMWGAIVALGILGYLLNIAFRLIERVILRWHRLQQTRLGSEK